MNLRFCLYGPCHLVAVLGILWGLSSAGCTRSGVEQTDVVRPAKILVVAEGNNERIRTFPGTVEAARRAELAFQVSGILTELPVIEGQQVAAGDLIARLRQDEFQARLDALKAQLDQSRANLSALRQGERPEEMRRREAQLRAAEARLVNTRADLQRMERLFSTRVVSQQEYDQAESQYQIAHEEYVAAKELVQKGTTGREEDILAMEAQVRGLEAQVVEASLHLSDSTLLAPYDGVIAQRFVEQNQNVRATEPVVTFQDTEEIDIAVDVPETVMVSDIQRADILQLTAELSAAPGVSFPVRIREIAQVADPTTQTFNVRVAMEVPEGIRPLPGMTARVTVVYRPASVLNPPMLIPVNAVVRRDAAGADDQGVWTVGPEETVNWRTVKLGEATGSFVEVLAGLAAGERIVTAGVHALREGMRIRDLGNALGGADQ